MPASYLSSLYLAYLMKVSEEIVRSHYGNSVEINLTFNSAVPISHLEKGQIREAFERAVLVAYSCRPDVEQGMNLDKGLEMCQEKSRKSEALPNDANRRAFVLAEPLAAVISYINCPKAREGYHSIVDLGAGTTDVSFFKRWTVGAETKIAFYYCDNHLVGGNNIDYALARYLSERQTGVSGGAVLSAARAAKENAGDGPICFALGSARLALDEEARGSIIGPICEEVFRGCQKTWRRAYEKESVQSAWERYGVFVVGGSSKFVGFRRAALKRPWEHIRETDQLEPVLPEDFTTLDDDSKTLSHNSHLFAVAYGVSRHYAEWPEFFRPIDVDVYEISGARLVPTWEQHLNQD